MGPGSPEPVFLTFTTSETGVIELHNPRLPIWKMRVSRSASWSPVPDVKAQDTRRPLEGPLNRRGWGARGTWGCSAPQEMQSPYSFVPPSSAAWGLRVTSCMAQSNPQSLQKVLLLARRIPQVLRSNALCSWGSWAMHKRLTTQSVGSAGTLRSPPEQKALGVQMGTMALPEREISADGKYYVNGLHQLCCIFNLFFFFF